MAEAGLLRLIETEHRGKLSRALPRRQDVLFMVDGDVEQLVRHASRL